MSSKVKIKELCKRLTSGGTPSRRKIEKYYNGGNINWVKTQELQDRNVYESEEKITEIALKESSAKLLPKNTVSMAMYGATVGKLGILKNEMTTNQACCNMVVDESKSNYRFIYYSLLYNREKLVGLANGAAQQNLNLSIIGEFEIDWYPLQEQQRISELLSSLDDKIELNNAINKNLEEMAQALFKHWFVDFEFPNENGEPYKSSGGEFEESELGLIPKGWNYATLGDLVEIIDNRGKTPPLSNERTNYPILDVRAISGKDRIINYDNCTKFVDIDTYETWFRNGHPKQGDILLSTVGSLAEMKIFFGNVGCIAQNVVGLRCSKISFYYMYQYLTNIKGELISYNIGSVQPSIKVTHINKHKILRPPFNIESKFHDYVKGISETLNNNYLQSKNLENIRDTLLPKLMSGEIRVPLEQDLSDPALPMVAESAETYQA